MLDDGLEDWFEGGEAAAAPWSLYTVLSGGDWHVWGYYIHAAIPACTRLATVGMAMSIQIQYVVYAKPLVLCKI